jgi:hypothetical protein
MFKSAIERSIEKLLTEARTQSGWGFGTTYDPRKALLEASALGLAFLGTDWHAVLAIVTVGFLALRTRDRIIHPTKATVAEAATDILIMAVSIVVTQLYFVAQNSIFAVNTPPELAHGVGLGMILVFTARFIFHVHTPHNDLHNEPEMRVVRAATRVTVTFGLAVSFIVGSGVQAVPGSGLRDGILGLTLMVSAALIRRLLTDSYLLPAPVFLSIKDPVTVEMTNSVSALPRRLSGKLPYSMPKVLLFVLIFLGSVFTTTGIALWRLWIGQAFDVNWIQVVTNLIALVILAPAWWLIMEINATTAKIVKAGVHQRSGKADELGQERAVTGQVV